MFNNKSNVKSFLEAYSKDINLFYLEDFEGTFAICYKSKTGDVYISIDDKDFHEAVVSYLKKAGVAVTRLQ